MKVSYKHLKTLIDFEYSPFDLDRILTDTGLEVEAIQKVESIKGGLESIVVGQVMSCTKHPDADKLKITKIDVGQENLLEVVCGAPNVAEGQKVVVALVGATLYPVSGEPFTIKKSKIRGSNSEGMLCAEDEIGIGHSHDGIIILDTNLPLGSPIASYYNLEADYVIEIGLTPNRADAASHLGVCRDISAVSGLLVKYPDYDQFKLGALPHSVTLSVENTEACPRFCGLEIRGVTVAESPEWLKNFLKTIGLNPINNIVDISNYVCHYLGQPMHIFDADQIIGNQIIVKMPSKGSNITTLDGTVRSFSGQDLAICNSTEPMAIAGVFGGLNSGVKATTTNLFLEIAYFNASYIRKTSTHHGLKTDASFRYERGTDPNMPINAIRFAANLIKELAGGEFCDKLFDNYPNPIANFEITLKLKNINRLIGKTLDKELIISILKSLDISIVNQTDENLVVSVPPYRVDVTREADVIEEILRIYGFDNIELSENLSSEFISDFPEKDTDTLRLKISDALVSTGFTEIQTLSIVKPADNDWINNPENVSAVKLLNPLSIELSEMRQSLLFSGLNALLYNINRRTKDLKVFEFGRTYHKHTNGDDFSVKEIKTLSLFLTGNSTAESWSQKPKPTDFINLYQAVTKITNVMRINKVETRDTDDVIFAYGLDLVVRNKVLAKIGLVNKTLQTKADIKQPVFYAEIDLDLLVKVYSADVKFVEIPKFPEVRRDLSLVVDQKTNFAQIKNVALTTEKKYLKNINVFDVYQGDKLEKNQKSYSLSFILIDDEKTLNDNQIDAMMSKLMSAFENQLGAIIRK